MTEQPGSSLATAHSEPFLLDRYVIVVADAERLLTLPAIDLFKWAFAREPHVKVGPLLSRCLRALPDDRLGILIGVEDGEYRGLSLIAAQSADITGAATVMQFYCKGSLELRDLLVQATVEWAKERGYASLLATATRRNVRRAIERFYAKAGKVDHVGYVYRIGI